MFPLAPSRSARSCRWSPVADQYAIVPAHYLGGVERHDSPEQAAAAAANAVAKDKVPRVVVKVHSEVRAAHEPRVDIVRVA